MNEKQMEQARRQARRQCAYGCVVCGMPVYNYTPISRNSDEADNIILLCPLHLAQRPLAEQLRRPYNADRQDNLFTYAANMDTLALDVAGHHINCDFSLIPEYCLLMIDSMPIFWITRQEGVFYFSLRLFNRYNELVAEIAHNQLKLADSRLQVNYAPDCLRLQAQDALLEMEFDRAGLLRVKQARLMRNGIMFQVKEGQVAINRKIPGNLYEEAYTIDNQGNPCVFLLGEAPVVMMRNELGQQRPQPLPALFPYYQIDRYPQ